MPEFRFGLPVTLIRRRLTGSVDEYGNNAYAKTTELVTGCAVCPGNTSEDIQGTSSVLSDIIVHMPLGTDVQWEDLLINPLDGQTYKVNGMPHSWISPFTGTTSLIEVPCVAISGIAESAPVAGSTKGSAHG